MRALIVLVLLSLANISAAESPYLVVLGNAQDAGAPQAGTKSHPGWTDPDARRMATSLGLIDPDSGQRWMFEATPDFPQQLHTLDALFPVEESPGLDGIFLTHAHIGHYVGLMYLGHEVMGARAIPVWAMPRMSDFLKSNGPWDQLVRYGNIELRDLAPAVPVALNERISVTPIPVPHRQEYSEVVGFRIEGPARSALFIPDIDSWEQWDDLGVRIEDEIAQVDFAFLDGTFFANGEIPGRDMSGFPHPFIAHSLQRFSDLPSEERAKIRFIHLNHTNPAHRADSEARDQVESAGASVAEEGTIVEL